MTHALAFTDTVPVLSDSVTAGAAVAWEGLTEPGDAIAAIPGRRAGKRTT